MEEWQSYKGELMNTLQNKLYKVGDSVEIGGQSKPITSINTIDGLKACWLLFLPPQCTGLGCWLPYTII